MQTPELSFLHLTHSFPSVEILSSEQASQSSFFELGWKFIQGELSEYKHDSLVESYLHSLIQVFPFLDIVPSGQGLHSLLSVGAKFMQTCVLYLHAPSTSISHLTQPSVSSL